MVEKRVGFFKELDGVPVETGTKFYQIFAQGWPHPPKKLSDNRPSLILLPVSIFKERTKVGDSVDGGTLCTIHI